jgi:glutamyl-Q tRNA(Asp) synthetase
MRVFRSPPLAAREEQANLEAGLPYAWRLSLSAAEAALGPIFQASSFIEETAEGIIERPAEPWRFGDVVLGRKDIGTSYHLASVLDDAAQGVTHVIRGEDLRDAAGLHALLHALFGIAPPIYRHHALVTGDTGQRLSKRNSSMALRAMRETDVTAGEVRAMLSKITGFGSG